MIVLHPSLDGRKGRRCGLVRRLAAALLAVTWTIVLSFAATSLWAETPEETRAEYSELSRNDGGTIIVAEGETAACGTGLGLQRTF